MKRGTIAYLGDDTGERGREWFSISPGPAGGRIYRSVSEIDDSDILRDVTCTVDARFRPLDCYERLSIAGRLSLAWFHFTDTEATGEGIYVDLGRASQRIVAPRPPFLVSHGLWNDGTLPACYDLAQGGTQTITGLATSLEENGSTGPILTRKTVTFEYLGEETLTVPAGTFPTRRFRLTHGGDRTATIWSTPDWSFVQVRSDPMRSTYVLTEYADD